MNKNNKSVFVSRAPAGKPVKAAKMMMDFWDAVHSRSPTAMNIPTFKNGQVNYEKLNKRRNMLAQ